MLVWHPVRRRGSATTLTTSVSSNSNKETKAEVFKISTHNITHNPT